MSIYGIIFDLWLTSPLCGFSRVKKNGNKTISDDKGRRMDKDRREHFDLVSYLYKNKEIFGQLTTQISSYSPLQKVWSWSGIP